MINGNQTPLLDAQYTNFCQRIVNGSIKGNLTQGEQAGLMSQMSQLQENYKADQAGGISPQERQQLWAEATQINQSIFDLRHNDLGTMGPGGADAHCPKTFLERMQEHRSNGGGMADPGPIQWQPPVASGGGYAQPGPIMWQPANGPLNSASGRTWQLVPPPLNTASPAGPATTFSFAAAYGGFQF